MCNEAARRIALDQVRNDWSQLKIPLRFPEGFPNFPALDSIRITDPAPIIRIGQGPNPEVASPEEATDYAEMVTRRWSWPAPSGKPVYNFRSDGREFRNAAPSSGRGGQGRCLIPIDGFYEFTDSPAPSGEETGGRGLSPGLSPDLTSPTPSEANLPPPASAHTGAMADPARPKGKGARAPKAKWEFRVKGLDWFCVAGLWRGGITFKNGTHGEAWTMLTTEPGPDIAPYHDRQIVILTPPDYARWLDGSAPAAALCRPLPAGTLSVERVR